MNMEQLATSLGVLIPFLSYCVRLSFKFGALDLKVTTMWEFQMRKAASEVVKTNIGTMNSPLTINPDAMAYLAPIKAALQNKWKTSWKNKAVGQVLFEIEAQFGGEILHLMCIPCGLTNGACLYAAYAVASEQPIIDIDFKKVPVQ